VHKKKGIITVPEKIVELTAKKRLGPIKSDRENDVLFGALGNAEHMTHLWHRFLDAMENWFSK
jgi:hypothetical protein